MPGHGTELDLAPVGDAPVAVLLFNYGGPASLDEVPAFLRAIFADPDLIPLPLPLRPLRGAIAWWIARGRAGIAREQYARIGGGSPLVPNTEAQARALQAALAPDGFFKVLLAMRYSRPDTRDAIAAVREVGARTVVLLPLYPQYSGKTTGSSVNEFERERRRAGLGGASLDVRVVRSYPDDPLLVNAIAAGIERALAARPEAAKDGVPLVLSAHGLPQSVVAAGDPYVREVETTARLVAARFPRHPSVVCFQSKVGRRAWLEPSTDATLARLAASGHRHAIVYPISFVSDHSETIYELDIFYAEKARAQGLEIVRVPALGADPTFIRCLRGLVLRAMAAAPAPSAS